MAWPQLARALASLATQAGAPPFEVLVLDGGGRGLPSDPDPPVRWIRRPGDDCFALRDVGLSEAHGSVVAICEDHCVAPPTWVADLAADHRASPALGLVGAMANHPDSSRTAADRASFALTFAGQTGVRVSVLDERLPALTNFSLKRGALELRHGGTGWLEYELMAELRRRRELDVAPSALLHHRQILGLRAPWLHLQSGRSYGASVSAWPRHRRRAWWRALPATPRLLWNLVASDVRAAAVDRGPPIADRLWVAGLILANVCGQALGAGAGPGGSRRAFE